jgi:hypothetical protein
MINYEQDKYAGGKLQSKSFRVLVLTLAQLLRITSGLNTSMRWPINQLVLPKA